MDRYVQIAALARQYDVTGVYSDGRTYLTGYVLELTSGWTIYVSDPEDTERELVTPVPGWVIQVDDGAGNVPEVHTGMRLEQVLALLPRLIGTYGEECRHCGAPIGTACDPFCPGATALEDTTTTED